MSPAACGRFIDPIFSERSSPVSFAGAKRFSNPPVSVEDLPHIDILVLSHDHYDHMDYRTIKELDEKVDRYIVPLGLEKKAVTAVMGIISGRFMTDTVILISSLGIVGK